MNCDSHFSIGKSHMVCEDYAYAGINHNGNHVAIISDGCSSSDDTDFGARAFTRSAFNTGIDLEYSTSLYFRAERLLYNSLRDAVESVERLNLSRFCLDTTLFYLEEYRDYVNIITSGDGFVIAKSDDGRISLWKIEYPSGAPFYFSYSLDLSRENRYREEFGMNREITRYLIGDETTEMSADQDAFGFKLPKDNYEFVAVCSDGIDTFDMPVVEVVKELSSFKNYTGEFVKRRVRAFLKKCRKNNINHSDDISMAAIHFGE